MPISLDPARRLSLRGGLAWAALALAAAFLGIGLLFCAAPGPAAAVFGIEAVGEPATSYVRALGIRDLALAGYIAALVLFSTRRAVGLLLAVTALIPVGDIVLLVGERGVSAPGSLALHGGGALAAAVLSALLLARRGRA